MALEKHDVHKAALLRRPAFLALVTAFLYALVAAPASGGAPFPANGIARLEGAFLTLSIGLAVVLIALSTIDALTFELPDALTLPLAVAGVLLHVPSGLSTAAGQLLAAGVAFALLAGLAWLYHAARGRAGLGLGDAKLLAAGGAWLGLAALPSVLLLAAGAALAMVLLARVRHGSISLADRIPFGPYLALAIWLVWLYGPIAASG